MHYNPATLLLAAAAAAPLAAANPINLANFGKSVDSTLSTITETVAEVVEDVTVPTGKFSWVQTAVSRTKGRNGASALRKAYMKYGAAVPTHVADAVAAGVTGSAITTPEADDLEYLTPVQVGNQTLNLDIDTGSADLWVFSSQLPAQSSDGHSVYIPNNSTKMVNSTWVISYGDGSRAAGNVFVDKVAIGGVTATSQAVEAATSVSAQFDLDEDNDGLVGLAFSQLNRVSPVAQDTFFDNVVDTLDEPVFTVDLKKGQPGTYDFGFVDASKHNGTITTVPVNDTQGYWGFEISGVGIGDGEVDTNTTITAIADTGTTLLMLPDANTDAYYEPIMNATFSYVYGGYIYPCNITLPDLTLRIGGYDAVVPGSYFNYTSTSDGFCYGGLQSSTGLGFSIIGDIFLKSQFVVFNGSAEAPTLGFAPKAL